MKVSAEISEQRGKRTFFACLALAVVLGLGVRFILSPEKIENRIRAELERSELSESLKFSTAEVSLASGGLPDFAIVLGRVEWRGPQHCADVAPLRASSVRVPIQMLSLLRGVPAGGRAAIDDLIVDIDGLKEDCSRAAGSAKSSLEKSEVRATPSAPKLKNATAEPSEIWSVELQQQLASMISGLVVSRAEIFFENRMKSVVIENLKARWRGEALEVSTNLEFPPAAVFGESLPSFSVSGTISRDEIVARIRAELSEGTLEANALLKPVSISGRRELESDVKLSVNNLPLSVVTPLFVKAGFVSNRFRPKFMWLDCKAEVNGIFSRLVVDHPVSISGCAVSGKVGRANVEEAVRDPSGEWRPLKMQFEKLDLTHLSETFDVEGPTGVLSGFGQMSGAIELQSRKSLSGTARWQGAAIRFAGSDGVAYQPVAVDTITAKLENQRWILELSDFKPESGGADIVLKANLSATELDGEFDLAVAGLKLSPRVEKVLFNGSVAEITGSAKASLGAGGRLSKLKSGFVLKGLQGSEIDSSEVRLEARLVSLPQSDSKSSIELSLRSVVLEVAKTGRLFRILEPTLLGWPGELAREGQRLVLRGVAVRGQFEESGFAWSDAKAAIGPRVSLTSRGRIGRDHKIEAEIVADYPLVSRLKWGIVGSWLQPIATVASPELGSLLTKAGVQDGAVTGTVPSRLLGVGGEKAPQPVR